MCVAAKPIGYSVPLSFALAPRSHSFIMKCPESLPFLDELIDVDELLAACDFSSTASLTLASSGPEVEATRPVLSQLQGSSSTLPPWLATAAPPTKVRSRKRTSDRRKEEIKELQQQIDELNSQLVCITPPPSNGASKMPDEGTACYLWLRLAQRQESERRRAERDNARLREVLVSQVKLMQSLRRVLRKAEKWKQAVVNSRDWLALDTTTEDRDIISQLVEKVERQLSVRTEPGAIQWLIQGDEQCIGRIRKDENGKFFYERERGEVLPFGLDLVEEVAWSSVCRGGVQMGLLPVAELTDDSVISTFNFCATSFEGFSDPEMLSIKTHFVLKRYRQEGRVVTAWESVSLVPESRALGTPALRWVQEGWGVNWSQQLPNGADGCATWTSTRASISVQDDEKADLGERGLKMVQVMAAALEESGRRVEKELLHLLVTAEANKRRRLK